MISKPLLVLATNVAAASYQLGFISNFLRNNSAEFLKLVSVLDWFGPKKSDYDYDWLPKIGSYYDYDYDRQSNYEDWQSDYIVGLPI